jgi:hypothetical protein
MAMGDLAAMSYMPIRTGSRRTLAVAMKKAGLVLTAPEGTPERVEQLADILLQLVVNGIDHKAVGAADRYWIIESLAPSNAVLKERPNEAQSPEW